MVGRLRLVIAGHAVWARMVVRRVEVSEGVRPDLKWAFRQ